MAKIKREELSGKFLEAFDKIVKLKNSDDAKQREAGLKGEKALEKLLSSKKGEAVKKEVKPKSKPKAKATPKSKEKPKAKPKAKSKSKPKAKTKTSTKPKVLPFSTRASNLMKKEGLSWADAKAKLSKEIKDEKDKIEAKLKADKKQALNELEKLTKAPEFQKALSQYPKKGGGKKRAIKTTLSNDGKRQALPRGKRVSKNGKTYYEYRDNRSDVNSLPAPKGQYRYKGKTPPYLADGGAIDSLKRDMNSKLDIHSEYYAKGGSIDEIIYSDLYQQLRSKDMFKSNFSTKPKMRKLFNPKNTDSFGRQRPYGISIGENRFILKYYYPIEEYRDDDFETAKKIITSFYNGKSKMAKGGRTISIVNDGVKYDKSKYKAVYGDFDKDGTVNIDDANPLDETKSGQVEQVELRKTFDKLLGVKAELDEIMYDAVETLDEKAPEGADIYARTKTPYSILKKLVEKRMLDPKRGLTDMIGTTIAVDNQKELEQVRDKIDGGLLGKVLDRDDFYKTPNAGYRAYHYIVEYKGVPVEVQLKTKNMKKLHEVSHEAYKNGTLNAKSLDSVSKTFMRADKGDAKAKAEISKLLSDKKLLASKVSKGYMAKGGDLERFRKTRRNDIYFEVVEYDGVGGIVKDPPLSYETTMEIKDKFKNQPKKYIVVENKNNDGFIVYAKSEKDKRKKIKKYKAIQSGLFAKGGAVDYRGYVTNDVVEDIVRAKGLNVQFSENSINGFEIIGQKTVLDKVKSLLNQYNIKSEFKQKKGFGLHRLGVPSQIIDYAKGGKIGFDGLANKVAKKYEGTRVPTEYQEQYGKTYNKKEAMEVGKKVAGKVYRQQQSMEKGGELSMESYWDMMIKTNLDRIKRIDKIRNQPISKLKEDKFNKNKSSKEIVDNLSELKKLRAVYKADNNKLISNFGGVKKYSEYLRKEKNENTLPFAKGGEVIEYSKVYEILKDKIDDAVEDIESTYEQATNTKGEEVESKSRDGFIPFTNGGYSSRWFEYSNMLEGSGINLPTASLDEKIEEFKERNREIGFERFEEEYPEIVKELGGIDNVNYSELEDAGYSNEADDLDMFMEDDDDSVMMEVEAFYYTPNNDRGANGKHTIQLSGVVNLEAPYHRSGNLEDYIEERFTFDSYKELEDKLDKGLAKVVSWFEGDMYDKNPRELKIRRMEAGGKINSVHAVHIKDNMSLLNASKKYSNVKMDKPPLGSLVGQTYVVIEGKKQNLFVGDKYMAKNKQIIEVIKPSKGLYMRLEAGGTLPTPFGQAGLVGETGTMNEMDLFAMGGGLPQGVHQYYGQTYNPAYPTPHGYAKGGKVRLEEGYKVYALADSLTKAQKEKLMLTLSEEEKSRFRNLVDLGDSEDVALITILVLEEPNQYRLNWLQRQSPSAISSATPYAKGGKTKRSKHSLMQDRRRVSSEPWEIAYQKRKAKMEAGGTLPTPFGQAGLVGETGAMNEMDMFAMGGGLPQGVHQYYGQTYNPAYPTPHGYAKGGKTQGYNDKLDESLGNTKGKRSTKEQNYKDRRNESEAMEKKGGKRKYASVKTMDKGNRKKRQTPMSLAKEIRKEGEKWQDAVKRASAMLKKK